MHTSASPLLTLHRACEDLSALLREHLREGGWVGELVNKRNGQDFWRPGDPADAVYVLERGAVEVTSGPGAGRVLLRRVHAGEPFGELCVCGERGGRRGSRAAAVGNSEAVRVGLSDFLTAAQRSRPLLNAIVATMCDRLADAEARAEILAERDAELRIAGLLLHLTRKEGGGRGARRAIYLSHAQIARMAAMSRSHTTVVLGRLRERGLLTYAPNRPLVVDLEALDALLRATHRGPT